MIDKTKQIESSNTKKKPWPTWKPLDPGGSSLSWKVPCMWMAGKTATTAATRPIAFSLQLFSSGMEIQTSQSKHPENSCEMPNDDFICNIF